MDLVQKCALAFRVLLMYEYHYVIGRKGMIKEFYLSFDKTDFHHLIGLHKFSLIKADYLLEGDANLVPSYLFLGKRNNDEKEQMCRTFFKIADKDYTQGQPCYTLLKKEVTIQNPLSKDDIRISI